MTRKFLIIGDARHGKDTVADIITERYGIQSTSSSEFAAHRVMMPYFDLIGRSYESVKECFDDRSNHRAEWYIQIAAYNSPKKDKLASEIMAISDIYVGMRCPIELEATRYLFDHTIWVDATGRGIPREDRASNGIDCPEYAHVIQNDGSLADLQRRVTTFMSSIGFEEVAYA